MIATDLLGARCCSSFFWRSSSLFNSGSLVFSASSISCVASVPRSTESEPLVSPEFVLGFGFALIAGAPSLLGFVFLASVRSSGSTSFFSGLISSFFRLCGGGPGGLLGVLMPGGKSPTEAVEDLASPALLASALLFK